MEFKDVKTLLSNSYTAIQEGRMDPVPFLLVGSTATAKSSLVKELGAELNAPVIQVRAALIEPSDLTGIPRADSSGTLTNWLKPCWWPLSQEEWDKLPQEVKRGTTAIVNNVERYGPQGILFFDEPNRGSIETIQAIFQVLTDYQIHTHILPSKYLIVGAMNPGNIYQTTDVDKAFWARWVQIKTSLDTPTMLKYATTKNYPQTFVSFISVFDKIMTVKEDFQLETFPNWRGWNFFAQLLKAGVIPKDCEAEVCMGCVGTEGMAAWVKYSDKKFEKPISGLDILKNYPAVEKQVLAQLEAKQTDRLIYTIQEVIAYAGTIPPSKVINNLTKFVLALKPELQMTILSSLPDKYINALAENAELASKIEKLITEGKE